MGSLRLSPGPLPRPADPPWRRLWPGGVAGRAALLGCAALVLALLLATGAAPAWRAEAGTARTQLAALRAEQVRAADRQRLTTTLSVASWPPMADDAARVQVLIGIAQRHGVRVRALRQERSGAGVPASRRDAPAGARWLRVAMSADGAYPALRRFVEAALAADAALALDSLVLQRGDAASASLRAEFGWALGSAPP